jgi:hypothetical protein
MLLFVLFEFEYVVIMYYKIARQILLCSVSTKFRKILTNRFSVLSPHSDTVTYFESILCTLCRYYVRKENPKAFTHLVYLRRYSCFYSTSMPNPDV